MCVCVKNEFLSSCNLFLYEHINVCICGTFSSGSAPKDKRGLHLIRTVNTELVSPLVKFAACKQGILGSISGGDTSSL